MCKQILRQIGQIYCHSRILEVGRLIDWGRRNADSTAESRISLGVYIRNGTIARDWGIRVFCALGFTSTELGSGTLDAFCSRSSCFESYDCFHTLLKETNFRIRLLAVVMLRLVRQCGL